MSTGVSARAGGPAARAGVAPGRRAGTGVGGESRPSLSVLDRKALAERARRRRERLLLAVSGLLVTGALGLAAGAQGLVTSQQLHLDHLDQQIAAAIARTQSLELSRARLAAPSRVLDIAENQLHMVTPSQVTYLPSVVSLGATGPARRTAGRHRRGG